MTLPTDRQKGFEARHTSQTRFGPRPVPKVGKRPHRATLGHRKSQGPSTLTAKILIWGGVGVMAAATTAGAVMATRKVADLISGDDNAPVRDVSARPASRFAQLSAREQDEVRSRVRARAMQDRKDAARARAAAARRRAAQQSEGYAEPRGSRPEERKHSLVGDLAHTASGLTGNITSLIGALQIAMAGFRTVSSQATGVVSEFSDVADKVRSFLGDAKNDRPHAAASDRTATRKDSDHARRA